MAVNKTKKTKTKTKAKDGNTSKNGALSALMAQIEGTYGKGAVVTGDSKPLNIPRIETDLMSFDDMLGGGVPTGRIIEIFGPESSGKTTLMLTIAAAYQRAGKTVAFVDAEHALDLNYARNLGVDISKMLVSQTESGEEALNITQMMTESKVVDFIIVDSVSALTPQKEIDGDVGDSHMGAQARMMGQSLRKLKSCANLNGVTVCFINQLRMKIGVMFGNPETTSGGNALKYYTSIRLDIRRIGSIKEGDKVVGNRVRVKSAKNKTAPPFQEKEFTIRFGTGFDYLEDLCESAINEGVIHKAGAWLTYGEHKVQGMPKLLAVLSDDKVKNQLMKDLKEARKSTETEKDVDTEDKKEVDTQDKKKEESSEEAVA